jgi:hypothetical protein
LPCIGRWSAHVLQLAQTESPDFEVGHVMRVRGCTCGSVRRQIRQPTPRRPISVLAPYFRLRSPAPHPLCLLNHIRANVSKECLPTQVGICPSPSVFCRLHVDDCAACSPLFVCRCRHQTNTAWLPIRRFLGGNGISPSATRSTAAVATRISSSRWLQRVTTSEYSKF